MKLNEIECLGYNQVGNTVKFLLQCDFTQAMALDKQELKVTEGGEDVAVFGGYNLTGVEKNGENTLASFAMKLEENVEQAMKALTSNLAITNKSLQTTDGKAETAKSSAQSALDTANDLSSQLEAYGEAIEELATQVLQV